ncbi:hypothetical protein ACHAPD_009367 [Fusarium lateritium]
MKQEMSMSPAIKLEGDELMRDFPIFPGLLDIEPDNNIQDEFVLGNDSMLLKGQVWPGMGKMDLADDQTRKARNQKKPKSVIDKMKKASECIEPTQFVMSSKLEVERTRDVYDDTSSPIPGQEESTPPKRAPKPKRKKATPLAEISGNIPKQRRRTARGQRSNAGKSTRSKKEQELQHEPEVLPSPKRSREVQDVFRDDVIRTGSFSHAEASYAMKDATIYNASSRLPFVPTDYSQFRESGSDHLRTAANYGFQLKLEEYPGSHFGDPTQGTNSPYIGITGTNPLFSNDRPFLNSYNQRAPNAVFSPLSFPPVNQQPDHSHTGRDTKQQTHMCETMEASGLDEEQELNFNGSWSLHDADSDMGFAHGSAMDDQQI